MVNYSLNSCFSSQLARLSMFTCSKANFEIFRAEIHSPKPREREEYIHFFIMIIHTIHVFKREKNNKGKTTCKQQCPKVKHTGHI